MALIKTAEQILAGRPRPVDTPEKGRGGRPLKYGHPTCKLEGCNRKHWGHGYCRNHGRKFILYGDPLWVIDQSVRCICDRCPVHAPGTTSFSRPNPYVPSKRGKGGSKPKFTHCQTPGCTRVHHGHGMCNTCKRKFDKWGRADHVYVQTGSGWCGCDEHKDKS